MLDSVLQDLRDDDRAVHVEELAPREAITAPLRSPLPAELQARLPHPDFWAHQAHAIDLARAGESVAISTGTASGKSLCFQVPVAEAALDGATSLLVFPTKALAQDQLHSFNRWDLPAVIATYDGDCSPSERTWVRDNAGVVLTNVEMLHQSILSNHRKWGQFLHRLRYVVVDELHTLRGVFGTHVAQVLRRLRRLIAHYGGVEPTFVFASATIGQPAVLASKLCGRAVTAVVDDASPSGPRSVVLWNPSGDEGHSSSVEAARVAARLIDGGLRTLVFCRSRRATEQIAAELRLRVDQGSRGAVRSYRAGYLPEERRAIESELASGALRGVVATSALELGVDIGGLDAVVMCGFPGTIASFWQQIGRCGRSRQRSLAVLVAGDDQLDQWMMRHPVEMFSRPPEPAVINLDNAHVYVPHLACASHESPLRHADQRYWSAQLDDGVRRLVLEDRATVRRRKVGEGTARRFEPVAVWSGRGLPAPTIGLRSAFAGEYRICSDEGDLIGTVDGARVDQVLHPGAIYLHQGASWHIDHLDADERVAWASRSDGTTSTRVRTRTDIRLLSIDDTRRVGAAQLQIGAVEVTSQVTGYRVLRTETRECIDRVELDLPERWLSTRAVWYGFDAAVIERGGVSETELPGALHAAEHAAIGILPLFTICDRWDVGGVSTVWLPETDTATVVIHDAHAGGAGIAEMAFEASDHHLAATLEVLEACDCTDGCPSCVQSPKCGNGNEPLHKDAARRLLTAVLEPARQAVPST